MAAHSGVLVDGDNTLASCAIRGPARDQVANDDDDALSAEEQGNAHSEAEVQEEEGEEECRTAAPRMEAHRGK